VTGAPNVQGRVELRDVMTLSQKRMTLHGASRNEAGGEVRDHHKDNNQIRNTDTVGKKDPYPPKG